MCMHTHTDWLIDSAECVSERTSEVKERERMKETIYIGNVQL